MRLNPTLILSHFRRILRQDITLKAQATSDQLLLMQEAEREGFDAFYLTIEKMRLKLHLRSRQLQQRCGRPQQGSPPARKLSPSRPQAL